MTVEAEAPATEDERARRRAFEALVMVSDTPAEAELLAALLECSVSEVDRLGTELADEYRAEGRGFRLERIAGGWRYESHPDCSPWVERFVLSGRSSKLSAAALETLAIVAYKQPISRTQVSAVRGVNADGVVRTLIQRGYLDEIARDPGPGQAVLLGTTPTFLERLGLDSLDELPGVADFVPGPDVVEALERGLALDDDAVVAESLPMDDVGPEPGSGDLGAESTDGEPGPSPEPLEGRSPDPDAMGSQGDADVP